VEPVAGVITMKLEESFICSGLQVLLIAENYAYMRDMTEVVGIVNLILSRGWDQNPASAYKLIMK